MVLFKRNAMINYSKYLNCVRAKMLIDWSHWGKYLQNAFYAYSCFHYLMCKNTFLLVHLRLNREWKPKMHWLQLQWFSPNLIIFTDAIFNEVDHNRADELSNTTWQNNNFRCSLFGSSAVAFRSICFIIRSIFSTNANLPRTFFSVVPKHEQRDKKHRFVAFIITNRINRIVICIISKHHFASTKFEKKSEINR